MTNVTQVLATFGDESITMDDVMKVPRAQDEIKKALRECLERRVILAEAQKLGLEATDEELQKAADSYRRDKRLFSAALTANWLKVRNLEVDDLEREALYLVMRGKLIARTSREKAEEFFHKNRRNFETARISHIVVSTEGLARELLTQIEEDEEDFGELAGEHSEDESTKAGGGLIGQIRRGHGREEIEDQVFQADAGDTVGPIQLKTGAWELIHVHSIKRPEFDDAMLSELRRLLFSQWLSGELGRHKVNI
jgi:parvulin-like peptidyl-prolyl isomerase